MSQEIDCNHVGVRGEWSVRPVVGGVGIVANRRRGEDDEHAFRRAPQETGETGETQTSVAQKSDKSNENSTAYAATTHASGDETRPRPTENFARSAENLAPNPPKISPDLAAKNSTPNPPKISPTRVQM